MTGRREPRPRRPKGLEDVPELSPEEVQRRVDVRGGAPPRGPIERPPRTAAPTPPPRPRRRGGNAARDSLFVLGLVVVGLVTLRIMLPQGPLGADASPSTTAVGEPSEVAVRSAGPQASHPTGTVIITLPPGPTQPATPEPVVTSAPTSAATSGSGPNSTPKPASTPKTTPKPATPPPSTGTATATLTVIVNVTNDNGGTSSPSSWTFLPNSAGTSNPSSFPGSSSGTVVTLTANAYYQVTDQGPEGYSTTLSANCSSAAGGVLAPGASETCTITKNDRQPRVNVYTVVQPGGDQVASDWQVTVTGTNVNMPSFAGSETGVAVRFDANASFNITQSNPGGGAYAESVNGTCSGGGLAPGVVTSCTYTYTPPAAPPAAASSAATWPLAVALAIALGLRGIAARRERSAWTTPRS